VGPLCTRGWDDAVQAGRLSSRRDLRLLSTSVSSGLRDLLLPCLCLCLPFPCLSALTSSLSCLLAFKACAAFRIPCFCLSISAFAATLLHYAYAKTVFC